MQLGMDAFLDIGAFVDEVTIGAEVEVGSEDVVKPKTRRSKVLKKAEKQLRAVARYCDGIVIKAVDAKVHIQGERSSLELEQPRMFLQRILTLLQ